MRIRGKKKVDFFGRAKTTKGMAPQKQKIAKFLEKSNFHNPRKHFNDTSDF